jgi:GNAT superfamily N-acetyltransferase
MIRKAIQTDIPSLLKLADLLVKETSYSHIEPSKKRIKTTIETMINNGFAMVAEVDGEVIGVMLGDVYTPWYSEDKLGIDYTLFVMPKHRNGLIAFKLITAFKKWAVSMGAKQIRCGIGTGVKNVGRLYERLGFKNVGNWYCLDV